MQVPTRQYRLRMTQIPIRVPLRLHSYGKLYTKSLHEDKTLTIGTFRPQNIMVGSPLAIVSYDDGPGESPDARQAFRMYFQTANGNVKEAVSEHQEAWMSAL